MLSEAAATALIGAAAKSGVDVYQILKEDHEQGRVSSAVWDELRRAISRANKQWEQADARD